MFIKNFNTLKISVYFILLIGLIGELQCLYKLINSDFEAPYKREIIYSVSFITGFGCIVGWLNIPDKKIYKSFKDKTSKKEKINYNFETFKYFEN